MESGEIYRHDAFYRNASTGQLERKYLVILARAAGGDIVGRLLTSRAHGRPENPRCFHGAPYPSFYLGVLGDPLTTRSWVDLRALEDIDPVQFQRRQAAGIIKMVSAIPPGLHADLLDCTARADDTTKRQENAIRDQLERLR